MSDLEFRRAHVLGRHYVGGRRRNFGGLAADERYVEALRNPTNSGHLALIYAVVLYTSATQWFRWVLDPTLSANVEVTAPAGRSFNLPRPAVSAMEMMSDTTVPTAADYWGAETRVTNNAPVPLRFALPVPVAPGMTFAVVGDSSAAQETCANVYFYERQLG